MTTVIYNKKERTITCEGHSGFAPRGQDIVCAAASATMRVLVVAAIECGIHAQISDGRIRVPLKEGCECLCKTADVVLECFKLLEHEYPTHVQVKVF